MPCLFDVGIACVSRQDYSRRPGVGHEGMDAVGPDVTFCSHAFVLRFRVKSFAVSRNSSATMTHASSRRSVLSTPKRMGLES